MTPAVPSSTRDVTISEVIANTREVGKVIRRNKRTLFRPLAITIPLGLLIAFGRHPEYTATTRILPYRTGQAASGFSSLAGLAGIRLPLGNADETITADLYPVIARTLDFRISVAETPLRFVKAATPITMVKYFQDHRSLVDAATGYLADLRSLAVSDAAADLRSSTKPVTAANGAPLPVYAREYLKIVQDLDTRLVVSSDKKTSVISITGVMPSPLAAADLVQTASERLMQRIIDYEANKAGEQLKFTEEQYAQARTRYQATQQNLADFADRNRIIGTPLAQVAKDRLQSEFNIAFDVFQQLSNQLELARLRKNQDTPVFTVIEHVTVPNQKSSPARARILLLAAFAGIVLGMLKILYDQYKPPSETVAIR